MSGAVRQPDMRRLFSLRFLALLALAACISDQVEQAFDNDDNDDTLVSNGKEDSVIASGYRSGCGAPIRTGSYALHGDVVTPTGVLPGAYVVVTDEKISAVGTDPGTAPVVETGGYIFPGLIDGHGHVEYNDIALADLGGRFGDRDAWPKVGAYRTQVKDPKNAVTRAGMQCEAVRHGEVRALVGGTTAIQGTPQIACARSLVRNLEGTNFCQDRVRQNVTDIAGFGRAYGGRTSVAAQIKANIAANQLDAFVVHAGEGIDAHAKAEWQQLVDLGLNVPQLVLIHTTAFGPDEYSQIAAAGAKVIWSPLSNLLLYGKTADIPTALSMGIDVSLGADWAPSGSPNLLAELKVADHVNQRLWNGVISDEQLVDMATINPARAYGLDKFIGSIEVGKYADLLVVTEEPGATAYRSLIDAKPQDVHLVTISGDPLYGDPALMDALGKSGDYEVIDACGSPRAIDVTVTARDVKRGDEKLADVEAKLQSVDTRLTPVIDCTDDAARAAYAGTPLE
jgi:cytosine/adenosine deaminase-related metal-dependent hydrolase